MKKKVLCCIVPAKDEATVIEDTLHSLMNAGLGPKCIYLVDDFSSDRTGDIGRALGVNVLRNEPNLGKAGAIKRVVEHFKLDTRYEFIALMDADTRVDSRYFAEMTAVFSDPEVVIACGRPKSRRFNWLTAYRACSYGFTHFVHRKGQSNVGVINVAPGCATVYRSSIWRELDWNKDTIVEDMDVTVQVHKKKLGKIRYVPKAIVHTQDPRAIRDYVKQMLRWNTGTWQVVRKHKLWKLHDKIDWEYTLSCGEGILFSLLYILMPILILCSKRFVTAVVVYLISLFITAAVVAILERRNDVFLYSITFPFIALLDASCFVCGFWKAIVRKQTITRWFTPVRY